MHSKSTMVKSSSDSSPTTEDYLTLDLQNQSPDNNSTKNNINENFQNKRRKESNHFNQIKLNGGPNSIHYPWIKESGYQLTTLGLHQEIEDFFEWITPMNKEHQIRCDLINRITNVITAAWSNATVHVYGSFRTCLYLPTSDIDVVVFGDWDNPPLHTIERILLENNIADPNTLLVLDKTLVPIVKITDKQTNIRVDISFNKCSGINVANLINSYRLKYPQLIKLTYVLKQFLHQRDLNEVFTGGLSSYALILLIVSFLHNRQPDVVSSQNLGILLIEFFELYGLKFDYNNTKISLSGEGRPLNKPSEMVMLGNLSIEDPTDHDNDVGRGSYGIAVIRSAFEKAYFELNNLLSRNSHNEQKSILSHIIGVRRSVIDHRNHILSLPNPPPLTMIIFADPDEILSNFRSRLSDKQPECLSHLPGDTQEPESTPNIEKSQTVTESELTDDNEVNDASSTSSSSSTIGSSGSSDTDSEGTPSCVTPSSAMSISPATSEVGTQQILRSLANKKIDNSNHKKSAPIPITSRANKPSFWGNSKNNSGINGSASAGSKDGSLDRSDLDKNWRMSGKSNRVDRADQDANWRDHEQPERNDGFKTNSLKKNKKSKKYNKNYTSPSPNETLNSSPKSVKSSTPPSTTNHMDNLDIINLNSNNSDHQVGNDNASSSSGDFKKSKKFPKKRKGKSNGFSPTNNELVISHNIGYSSHRDSAPVSNRFSRDAGLNRPNR